MYAVLSNVLKLRELKATLKTYHMRRDVRAVYLHVLENLSTSKSLWRDRQGQCLARIDQHIAGWKD